MRAASPLAGRQADHANASSLLALSCLPDMHVRACVMHAQTVPLTKLTALPKRIHELELQKQMPALLAEPHLHLMQWLPDVGQVREH